MKVYVILSVGSGMIARIYTDERKAVDNIKSMPRAGLFTRTEWEVIEMETDGHPHKRTVYTTLDNT